MDILLYTHTL